MFVYFFHSIFLNPFKLIVHACVRYALIEYIRTMWQAMQLTTSKYYTIVETDKYKKKEENKLTTDRIGHNNEKRTTSRTHVTEAK